MFFAVKLFAKDVEQNMSLKSILKALGNKSSNFLNDLNRSRYIDIFKPIKGRAVPLKDVNDPAFKDGMLGKGCGIIPEDDLLYSPVNGQVVSVFPTKHAITILSDEGMEILIHLGIDTVNLKGDPFEVYVKGGDRVNINTKLAKMDNKSIKQKNFDNTVIIVVTNPQDFQEVVFKKGVHKYGRELLLSVERL